MNSLFTLKNKTALVTGASRGIGKAIAIAYAQAGADVIVVASNKENTINTVSEIQALGKSAYAVACDQSNSTSITQALNDIESISSRVDIVVNSAGIISRAPAEEYSMESWQKVIDTNLNGVFHICRELGKNMLEQGSGKIINIASLLSFQGGIRVPAYSASKGAVALLTKALANEWANRGIQVNAIAPGYIATDNTEALRADAERNQAILDRIPAGRWGEAEDLVGAAIFLASSASDYVNGHILTVDGGWMAR